MNKTLILKPRISEKAYGLSQTYRTYVFDVPRGANKLSIAGAVAAQFGVTVKLVNVMNIKGKPKRSVRKGARPTMGSRSNSKKAYVTLAEGDSLPIFANVEDDAAKSKEKK